MSFGVVRLISRPDGSTGVHHTDTGRLLFVFPPREYEPTPVATPLDEQLRATTQRRRRERRSDLLNGIVGGLIFMAGVVVGVLLTYV